MMQQVNLYQPPKRGSEGALMAQSALPALLAIMVALAGIWGYSWWQLHGMRREADFARAQRASLRSLEAARTAELDTLAPEELDKKIVAMDAEVTAKTRALQTLRAEVGTVAAFSDRLAALSRRHLDGVWLEQLTLGASHDAMSLTGAALAPDLVPRYLKSLAGDAALRGGEIDNFVIDRPSPEANQGAKHLRFRAATRALQAAVKEPEAS